MIKDVSIGKPRKQLICYSTYVGKYVYDYVICRYPFLILFGNYSFRITFQAVRKLKLANVILLQVLAKPSVCTTCLGLKRAFSLRIFPKIFENYVKKY